MSKHPYGHLFPGGIHYYDAALLPEDQIAKAHEATNLNYLKKCEDLVSKNPWLRPKFELMKNAGLEAGDIWLKLYNLVLDEVDKKLK